VVSNPSAAVRLYVVRLAPVQVAKSKAEPTPLKRKASTSRKVSGAYFWHELGSMIKSGRLQDLKHNEE
jgi:hypothetical protein